MQLRALLVDRCGIGGKQRRQIGRGNLGIRIEFFDNGWQLIRFRTHQATDQPFDAGRFLLCFCAALRGANTRLRCEIQCDETSPRASAAIVNRDRWNRLALGIMARCGDGPASADRSACGCRAIPRGSADGGSLAWRSTGLSVPPVSAPPGPGESPSACGSAIPAGSEPDNRARAGSIARSVGVALSSRSRRAPSGSVGVIRRSSGSRMWIRSSKSLGRFAYPDASSNSWRDLICPLMSVPLSGSRAFSTAWAAFWCRRCSGGAVEALKVSSRNVTPDALRAAHLLERGRGPGLCLSPSRRREPSGRR